MSRMIVAIPRERVPGEHRVALVPESVKRLVARKLEVHVERGAGEGAFFSDADYEAVGAKLVTLDELLAAADVVIKVQPPTDEEVGKLREGSWLCSLAFPLSNPELVRKLCAHKVTLLCLDMIPRTTLAQMMDVLSSQATLAGYRAVLLAAEALPKFFPMLMTAAGTIPPAKVLVLGAGVAGLQADRDGASSRRGRRGVRRAQGREGAGRVARRALRQHRRRRCGGRRWLREGAVRRAEGKGRRSARDTRRKE